MVDTILEWAYDIGTHSGRHTCLARTGHALLDGVVWSPDHVAAWSGVFLGNRNNQVVDGWYSTDGSGSVGHRTSNMLANLEQALLLPFFAANYVLIFMRIRTFKSRAKAVRAVLGVSSNWRPSGNLFPSNVSLSGSNGGLRLF